jgi:hypothetical protein
LHLTNDDHWRKIIWQSRGNGALDKNRPWIGLSEDLAHYTAKERLGLSGKICGQSTEFLKTLTSERDVRPLRLANGQVAEQYVFFPESSYDARDELQDRVWLEERKFDEASAKMQPSSGKGCTRGEGSRSGYDCFIPVRDM